MSNIYDIAIIGAGPAGMTAAVYASRANLSVVMLEKSTPGGKMTKTAEVENYPGFDRIDGPDLSMKMFEHSQKAGAEYRYGDVIDIIDEGKTKKIITSTEEIVSKAIIIASGTKQRDLNVPGEKELAGRGISWCAICDGAFFKGKEVAVIGGGNSAVEEALYLANLASKVTVIHRRDELRADKIAQERIFEKENVEFVWNSTVKSFDEVDGKLGQVTVEHVETGEEKVVKAEGSFIYIGADPVTDMVKNLNITNDYGYIEANDVMETRVPGVYGAGDVCAKELRQIATAVSDGANAAQSAIKYIEKLG